MTENKCEWCGKMFSPKSLSEIYCSNKCLHDDPEGKAKQTKAEENQPEDVIDFKQLEDFWKAEAVKAKEKTLTCKNGHKIKQSETLLNEDKTDAICPECGNKLIYQGAEKSQEEKDKELGGKIATVFVIAFIIACGYFAFSGDTSSSSGGGMKARLRCFKACEEMERAAVNDRSKYGYSFNQTECMDKCRVKHP